MNHNNNEQTYTIKVIVGMISIIIFFRVYYGYTKHRAPRNNNSGSVISLRSAGDISLSGGHHRGGGGGSGHHRQTATGLLLPASGSGQPTTIIPLKRQNRESGDYATSDVQSVWYYIHS